MSAVLGFPQLEWRASVALMMNASAMNAPIAAYSAGTAQETR